MVQSVTIIKYGTVNNNNKIQEKTILRGVKQGDQFPPKLFTAAIQGVFKYAELEEKE